VPIVPRRHRKDRTPGVTNHALSDAANQHMHETQPIVFGQDDYFGTNLLLSFNDLFHRMTGAEYRFHVPAGKLLVDDCAQALPRLSDLALGDRRSAGLQRVHWAHDVKQVKRAYFTVNALLRDM
jgi:hypothetical protein